MPVCEQSRNLLGPWSATRTRVPARGILNYTMTLPRWSPEDLRGRFLSLFSTIPLSQSNFRTLSDKIHH